LAVSC